MTGAAVETGTRPEPRFNLSPWAVRPYLFERQAPYAESAELIARTWPKHTPLRPVLAQAVLMDLAWLYSYLGAASEEVTGLAPPRRVLEAFLEDLAPEHAKEWMNVHFLDEPTRWEFRVRVSTPLGRALNRLLLPTMTCGYALVDKRSPREAKREVRNIAMAELSMARNVAPVWKESISEIKRSVAKATRRAKSGK